MDVYEEQIEEARPRSSEGHQRAHGRRRRGVEGRNGHGRFAHSFPCRYVHIPLDE